MTDRMSTFKWKADPPLGIWSSSDGRFQITRRRRRYNLKRAFTVVTYSVNDHTRLDHTSFTRLRDAKAFAERRAAE